MFEHIKFNFNCGWAFLFFSLNFVSLKTPLLVLFNYSMVHLCTNATILGVSKSWRVLSIHTLFQSSFVRLYSY